MRPDDVLIVADLQNDFLPGGALGVPHGDEVIAPINGLVERFQHVVLTQDWHPPGHVSFASSHPCYRPGDTIVLPDGSEQLLWPDHCLQGSVGAAIAASLAADRAELVIRKGYRASLDSYSAFIEADRRTGTGLAGYLRERGLRRVIVAGLATDFCVAFTAIDAARSGFETLLVFDASRPIDRDGSLNRALRECAAAGVELVGSASLPA